MSDDSGPKLVTFAPAPSELEKANDKLVKSMPLMAETVKSIAMFRRIAYQAYLKEGFTEAQALELCCK